MRWLTAVLIFFLATPRRSIPLAALLLALGAPGSASAILVFDPDPFRQTSEQEYDNPLGVSDQFAGVGLFVVYFPTWLETTLGFSAGQVSAVYVLGGIANVLAGPRAGRLSDRIGRKPVIVAASAGVGVLMASAPLVAAWPPAAFGLFFGIMALAASRISPLQALLTEMVPAARRGAFMSLTAATGNAGFRPPSIPGSL